MNIEDWKYEVANGDTRLGYEDWAMHRLVAQTVLPNPADTVQEGIVLGAGWGPDTEDAVFYYRLTLNTDGPNSGRFSLTEVWHRLNGDTEDVELDTYDNIVEATLKLKTVAGM